MPKTIRDWAPQEIMDAIIAVDYKCFVQNDFHCNFEDLKDEDIKDRIEQLEVQY